MRADMNELDHRKPINKNIEIKNGFLKRSIKLITLAKLTKEKRKHKLTISSIKKEIPDSAIINRMTVREYWVGGVGGLLLT